MKRDRFDDLDAMIPRSRPQPPGRLHPLRPSSEPGSALVAGGMALVALVRLRKGDQVQSDDGSWSEAGRVGARDNTTAAGITGFYPASFVEVARASDASRSAPVVAAR